MSPVARNPVFGVSDQVRHKPSCPATVNGKVPGIQIYKEVELYYLHVCTCSENKGADQLCSNCAS